MLCGVALTKHDISLITVPKTRNISNLRQVHRTHVVQKANLAQRID
jgi:hypothetical protein